MNAPQQCASFEGVAIIGTAGRFPGARSVEELWRNQIEGVEAISRLLPGDLEVAGGGELARDPDYVRARSVLKEADLFDADFFGIHTREAELIDPQQRVFLECCWEAFENAGYDPGTYRGAVGVYAGCSPSTYFLSRLCSKRGFVEKYTAGYQVSNYPEMLGNNPDFLATRVSYKLNLRGPSYTVQAGCSTSLIAVSQACQSLLTYQSDMALAGGCSITFPQKRGALYQEGGMISPDGHCRTFDSGANGTVFGSGAGVVLLKRIEDALGDGDHIYAVIRGFAINNDGSLKVGFTAPSVEGQARVIALALEAAGLTADAIGYVEAHGTATPLGDPIELAALTQAFRLTSQRKGFCAIGTVKTNVGHLDIASGVTGLLHAVQVVRHGIYPPTLHFQQANPKLDLENSPFYVNTAAAPWKGEGPRRAGVSSFGVGGTNVHLIIEQAPNRAPRPEMQRPELIVISARSEEAWQRAAEQLVSHFLDNPRESLADAAWTLQAGRKPFAVRGAVTAAVSDGAAEALATRARKTMRWTLADPGVCFLFPGQGSQYPNMGKEIYSSEPVFRDAIDRCASILRPHLKTDLRELLFPPGGASPDAERLLTETTYAQPAIFAVEYALAQLWMSWNIRPRALFGHSVGEFAAGCLAGVFSLEDGLRLVVERGKIIGSLPRGGMLSVRLPEEALAGRLNGHLSLAAVNALSLCVVSGPFAALESLEEQLAKEGVAFRRLKTSHAFHSAAMDPILEPFAAKVAKIALRAPKLPYISCVTGQWITEEQATDPAYWARHCRQPVRFYDGIAELRKVPNNIFLEIGPGDALATLARQHTRGAKEEAIVSCLGGGHSGSPERDCLMDAVGAVWAAGAQPDWTALRGGRARYRIPLPTYPFERKRYWLDSPDEPDAAGPEAPSLSTSKEKEQRVNTATAQLPCNPESARRITEITQQLTEIFEELSGDRLSPEEPNASFLAMGFDSLFLTQVSQALQGRFGLKITFRQLLGDQGSLASLAEYLDRHLPASALGAAPVPAPLTAPAEPPPEAAGPAEALQLAAPSGNDVARPEGSIERLVSEQLQAMSQLFAKQLEVIGAQGRPNQPSALAAPLSAAKVPAASSPHRPESQQGPLRKEEFKPFGPYKPPQRTATGVLTETQKKALRSLIEQYSARTANSKRLTQENRRHLADPRVVAGFRSEWKEIVYPIVTVRSKGSRLWDIDGNEYIDILNGFGPIMLGHRPDFVEEAIEEQLHQGFEIGPQTPLAGEIAREFCELTGNERMTFCNTGSEAVMAALRVARTVTARNRVVLFGSSYHGMFDEVLVKGLRSKVGAPHSAPVAPGIPRDNIHNMTVLEYGTPETLEWIRNNARDLAAVLVEPVQSRRPSLRPVEFLREVRRITQESGTALIFDEVVTGFRVHPGGCQALFDIRADMATYGKVVAGGMPIGILAGKAAFLDALDGGQWQYGDESYPETGVTFFAGTFVRHPLTLAAVKAVLRHFRQEGPALQEGLTTRTSGMVSNINRFFEANGLPTRLENFGSIFYFAFPPEERLASLFYYYMRMKGIHVMEGFPCFLTTAHTDADIERIVGAFRESGVAMQDAGFLPRLAPASPAASATRQAPLTESQLEVWLSDQLGEEASCSYNESFTLRLRGEVNGDSLKQALEQVLARHDALRATFSPAGDFQQLAEKLELDMPSIDLSGMEAGERESRFCAIVVADASIPFRLAEGPLIRLKLLHMEARQTRLLITTHHIVCDGWSTNLLLDELARCYNAIQRRTPCELPPVLSFAEYAQSQKQFFEGAEGALTEQFWLEQFSRASLPLELPLDNPRPSVREFRGATYRTTIGAAAYNRIKKLGSKQNCTLFTTLLAGFQLLLSRLSGQDDIVVGIPTAGQSLVEGKALVGHCVNFLPLRSSVRPDAAAADFLNQTRAIVLAGYEHQNYAYGRLVRKLSLKRDPSRLPLTEVQFNVERLGTGVEFDGLEAEIDPNPKRFVNFDIFLNIVESRDGLTLDCDYNTGLFHEETIARWLRHYEALLEGMAADVRQTVACLPLLDEDSRRQLLAEFSDTAAEVPPYANVHQWFEAQVRRTPNRPAAVFGNEQLTYAELDARANQLAHYLVARNVGPGALAAVFVERSLDMIVSLLAILKSGAAYIPLDPTYPAARISFVLTDSAAPVLLTQSKLAHELAGISARPICLDLESAAIGRESPVAPQVEVGGEDLAYVIYTSGSTGKPKGVEIQHRALMNLLHSMQQRPGLAQNDTLLAVTTLSFDIAGLELFLPLVTGSKLVIASREAAADGNRLLDLARSSGATVMQATPITWKLLLEAGWNDDPRLKVLCGGEAFPRELAEALLPRASGVWNMYGPTETTIWSSTAPVLAGDGPVLLGSPIANTEFYVVDQNGELTPPGVPGELYIGGAGLARGYFQQPELTREKFISNPFSSEPENRVFKTGDLVRRRSNGGIEFLGRLDHQVKLRGFRIELGEVETALARYPGVREAVVIVREDIPGDKRLVAYISSDQQALTIAPIREFLTGKLPNYMLPSAVVRLDSMPLTPNGKIDRKALLAPDLKEAARERPFEPPRTDREKTLAGVWAEVLHLDQVGVDDNLFELGADSLHVFQIAARTGKLGISIPPALFLRYRTIASLCAYLDSQNGESRSTAPEPPAIVRVNREKYRMPRVTA